VPVPCQPEVAPGNPGEPHSTLSGLHQRGRSRSRGVVSGLGEVIAMNVVQDEGPLLALFGHGQSG
jgi:hypothetical protein